MILILIVIVLLLVIAVGVCKNAGIAKQRYIEEHPEKYYYDAGWTRMIWAFFTALIGIAFPPLWLFTVILFLVGLYSFRMSKTAKESK